MADQNQRLISLDALRGLTIMFMILVNNPGSWKYVLHPLGHAKWHGCTPTDLVFPFFLFIMGAAMAFSLSKYYNSGASLWPVYKKIIRRTVILFLLGFILNYAFEFDLSAVRIPGVLQRIALCYFFSAVMVIHLKPRTQIITSVLLLLAYWIMMVWIPFEGKGADHWAYESNFAKFFDSLIIKGHTWKPDFDPEGIISTITSIVTTMSGYFTGLWLRRKMDENEKIIHMFTAGNIMIVIGLFLEYWMPINKSIWTASYVIYTSGIAIVFLAIFYWVVDIKGFKSIGTPFIIFGSNAITVYFASSLFGKILYTVRIGDSSLKELLWSGFYEPVFGPWLGSVMYAVIFIAVWYAVAHVMYNKKVFIKI